MTRNVDLVPDASLETWPIDRFKPYKRQLRDNDGAVDRLCGMIMEFGFRVPILAKSDGTIIDGDLRLKAAKRLGLEALPVVPVDDLDEAQIRGLRVSIDRVAQLSEWNWDSLREEVRELAALDFNLDALGFEETDIATMLADIIDGDADPDDAPTAPENPVSRTGDVWELGRHRLACGSSTAEDAAAFFDAADLVLTDPPYCSGGFQESDRGVGSVGTARAHKQIANDRLSTRGYQALLRQAVFGIPAEYFYVFTDWRMWTALFDLAEEGGAGVRSMITWDKGTPGMGRGWRSQHELIMWACRKAPPYAKGFPGMGNVITMSRQANELHTTQKPVELIRALMQGAPFARVVADPFSGSATTLIAAELENRDCLAMELDPAYVDVGIQRWERVADGQARLAGDGRTFAEVEAQRAADQAVAPKSSKSSTSKRSKKPTTEST